MRLLGRRTSVMSSLRHPRTTVRWRLTLLYGGVFLISGAVLLAVTYTLVDHATVTGGQRAFVSASGPNLQRVGPQHAFNAPPPPVVQQLLRSSAGRNAIRFVGTTQRIADLHQLVIESAIALAVMAVISAALGWVIAGRVLRPLRTITATTQQISEANLHERLAIQGPPDELTQLADTIDGLLGRLQAAFDAQRQFVANASHELRTPLTTVRALLEMSLSDPRATVATFRASCEQALEEGEHQEQLIDALLALARGQQGIYRREPIDLAEVAAEALDAHRSAADAHDLRLDASLEPALLGGDRRLIERLTSNLLQNGIRHNAPGGQVQLDVRAQRGQATLRISNTGPLVPAEEIERLLQPFQRLAADRVDHGGLGLGLSIISAIAAAHGAMLDIRPGADGGLDVEVRFPRYTALAELAETVPSQSAASGKRTVTVSPPSG